MIPSAPIYRISFFLAKILGEDVETPTPTYREEFYLAKILGEDVELPQPVSRLDYYLAKIAGMDVEIPTPQYRAEFYLAKIAGMEVELPLAISRLDQYLVEWAGTPQGEAVTVTGVSPLLLESAMEAELISLIQSGKVSQASTPSGSYVPIVCNNGELKYGALGNNLANVCADTAQIGYYISATGVVTEEQRNWMYKYFIPVKPNTQYTLSLSSAVYFVSISEYSSAADSGFIVRKAGDMGSNTTLTITTEATTNYIRFGANIDTFALTLERVLAINWMLNEGNTALPYEAFRGGLFTDGTAEVISIGEQTASAESLYAVGDYADTQEVISGAVTRKVGVLVLDGTENWGAGSAGTGYRKFSLTIPDMIPDGGAEVSGLCSHYKWEYANVVGNFYFASSGSVLQIVEESSKSLSAFKSFLAAQYAAGTPVIVLYPLAESTTEQTAPQTLATVTGDNTLTVTANVSDIPISVTYMRANS